MNGELKEWRIISKPGAVLVVKVVEMPKAAQRMIALGLKHGKEAVRMR